MYNIKSVPFKMVQCRYRDGEQRVQDGLACTPQQALELAQQGVPISTQMANPQLFDDGVSNPGSEVPMERQRGVSINDMWNEQCRIEKEFNSKLNDFRKNRRKEEEEEEKGVE